MTYTQFPTASNALYTRLCAGHNLSKPDLRNAMVDATGATDASSAWSWSDAYDVAQHALSKFIVDQAHRLPVTNTTKMLQILARLETMLPVQTHRDDETINFQQFNTPAQLGYAMCQALGSLHGLRVLEPSAGTGTLAALASALGAHVHCNELSTRRATLLRSLFATSEYDATTLHHRLGDTRFDAVLMNPPFGRIRGETQKSRSAMYKHIASASRLLAPKGRLVSITSENFSIDNAAYRKQIKSLARLGLSCRISVPLGALFKSVGTSWPVRLTVWEKSDASQLESSDITSYADLCERLASLGDVQSDAAAGSGPLMSFMSYTKRKTKNVSSGPTISLKPVNIEYRAAPATEITEIGSYAAWTPRILVEGAKPHPSALVQSLALAATTPQMPTTPLALPRHLIDHGILTESQIEVVIRANHAHSLFIPGRYSTSDDDDGTVLHYDQSHGAHYRLGFYLGDGTGAAKSRPICGLFLLNYLQGRKKGIWISMNTDLSDAARKEWEAVGGAPSQIVDISRFKINERIGLSEGILFVPYGTLRSSNVQTQSSRLAQVLDWVGSDFDGMIAFDEAHAMAKALPTKSSQGRVSPGSLQGRVGLQLQNQLPSARVVYSSATSSVEPRELTYANRLGLFGHQCPFEDRGEFLNAMDDAGLTGMEVISRDLSTAGRYVARNLSFEGIEYSRIDHELTPKQIRVWDQYADAFTLIHQNILDALEACDASSSGAAKSAAYSQFESTKQRFFNQLMGSMESPSLILDIEQALKDGKAVVIQLTTTGEAYLDRALQEITPDQYDDLQVDLSPRRMIVQMLESAFPTVAYHEVSDGDGGTVAEPLRDAEGRLIHNPDAIAAREEMITKILTLPPMPAIIDHVIWHFGSDAVAEVTGRTKRVVLNDGVYQLQKRSAGSRMRDIKRFEDDEIQILIFSEAGAEGRGFHADLNIKNQRKRHHIVAEPGWRASKAVQAMGRTPRTNQAQQPELILLSCDCPGKRRFTSTITRRLDSLGAMTKGQRDTGSNGLFSSSDSLEGDVANYALYSLLRAILAEKIEGMTCAYFERVTGLNLNVDFDENPVPVNRFLNRVLALRFADQHLVFDAYMKRYASIREQLREEGRLERSIETLSVDAITLIREVEVTESVFGSTIARQYQHEQPCSYPSFNEVSRDKGTWFISAKHDTAVHVAPCFPLFSREDGSEIPRVSLEYPDGTCERVLVQNFSPSEWVRPKRREIAKEIWEKCQADLPKTKIAEFWLISGALLPVWTKLASVSSKSVRIVRLVQEGARTEIGAFLSPTQALSFLSGYDVETSNVLDPATVAKTLMSFDKSFTLTNGWRLKRSKVMYENRIELIGPDFDSRSWVENIGVFNERISFGVRWFIPVDKATEVLTSLLAKHPLC